MLKSPSVTAFKAFAEQVFKTSATKEEAIKQLIGKAEINGQVYDIQYPSEGFTVQYVGSGTDPSVTPLTESPAETAEKIQQILRDLQVTGMGPASDETASWLGGAEGGDGKEPPRPESPKPDEVGAVGGVEIPPPPARRPIDLSNADAELLSMLRGMSLAAQADIVDNWPMFTPVDYSCMLDTEASAQEMPGDKSAKVDGVEVTSQMLKRMQVNFDTTAEFQTHAEQICSFPRTVSAEQTQYMLSGRVNVCEFDFKIDWEGDKPKVEAIDVPKRQKQQAEKIRQQLTEILERAYNNTPSTSSEGASAKP